MTVDMPVSETRSYVGPVRDLVLRLPVTGSAEDLMRKAGLSVPAQPIRPSDPPTVPRPLLNDGAAE